MGQVKPTSPELPKSDAFKALEEAEKGADNDLQSTVTRMIQSADRYFSEELEAAQVEATDYYFARPFGDEEEGRSKVVSTDLRDAVESVMPSMLRIFLGSDAPVEFQPRRMDQLELARQQTDVVNHIVVDQNDGFRLLMGVFDDALVRKIGVVKYFWDESTEVLGSRYSGLTIEEVVALTEEEGVEIVSAEAKMEGGVEVFDVEIKRTIKTGRVRVEGVPNEEFRYAPARRLLESSAIVHSRERPASDLVAMGMDEAFVARFAGKGGSPTGQDLYQARQLERNDFRADGNEGDKSMRPVLYTEAHIRIDADEDGIAEWRLFRCVGEKYTIDPDHPDGELVDGPNYAVFSPRPLAHLIAGLDFHDFLKDIQRIMSQVERGILDSLALSLEQKVFFKDGMVNPRDLTDPDILNFVRTYGDPNQVVRIMEHSFIGPEALPVLEWYEHKKEERTGITKASKGLDADSLQSATKQAVAGTLQKAQERIEMIARAFAETGMKDLFKGILRLVVRHQSKPFVVRLRGKYVEVDPRDWTADMDVVVNVGTGTGTYDERIQTLMAVAEDQAAQMAAQSPLVNWTHVRNVRSRLVRLMGYGDVDEFYAPWGQEQQQAYDQQMAQASQNPTDPTQVLAQIENGKLELQAMVENAKLQLQAQKLELEALRIELEDDRARDKAAQDAALKEFDIELSNQADIEDAKLKAKVAERRAELDADVKRAAVKSQGAANG